jgi:RNAse (barnase) inhibitor barstar
MDPIAKQLADAQHSGVYQLKRNVEDVEHAARKAGLVLFRIDTALVNDKKGFLEQIAKALHFPGYFGHNWDALNDCLTDLGWLATKHGYVLVFENMEHFGASSPREFSQATDVLRSVSEYWKGQGAPFWAFVVSSSGWDCTLPFCSFCG